MPSLTEDLDVRLAELRAAGLHRELRRIDSRQGTRLHIDGRELVNFSSNDYLGLTGHPALAEAASRALRDWGCGSTASRLVCGSLAPHHELEARLADWKQTGAALSFATGYSAALGTIPALVGTGDIVVVDRLVHACCVDAARQSGAQLRVFRHNDLARLADILKWADGLGRNPRPRVLVVTESVFSMDGDRAPLRELVELKDRHGAWLMLDEAHAGGLLGTRRAGLADAEGLTARIEVQMGTLGKALGCAGGYIAGSSSLVEFLINRARTLIFSTAPPPSTVAAASCAIDLVRGPEGAERCLRTWSLAEGLAAGLPPSAQPATPASAILPWHVGDERRAVRQASALRDVGFFVPAIRHPTVGRGAARLRFTVTAAHTPEEVARVTAALSTLTLSL